MSVPANQFDTYTVVASPTVDAEVVIATLNNVGTLLPALSVKLAGWANVTKAAAATDAQLAIRRTSLTGDVVVGPLSVAGTVDAAADGITVTIEGVDNLGDFAQAVYVLTLTMTTAATASTVNAVAFHARVD